MSKLARTLLGLLAILIFIALPLFAYEVALKDGRVIHFQKYRVTETDLFYVDDQGKEIPIPLSSVDFDRTRKLNANENPPFDLPGLATRTELSSSKSEPSLGDIAKKVRPKSAKVTTQRVFTNEDAPDQGVPPQPDPTESSRPTMADEYRATLLQLDRWLEDKAGKTPRELSNSVAGEIQFPGRDKWEQRIFDQKEKLVSTARSGFYVIQRMGDAQTPEERTAARIAIEKIRDDVRVQRALYDQLITEGVKKASEWEKRPR